jgi:opacity protein-like surface antigen
MNKTIWSVLPIALILVTAPVSAQRFGAQLNWADGRDLGLGARVELPLRLQSDGTLARAYGIGSFDYYFWDCGAGFDDCSYWELNFNGAVPLTAEGFNPYVGAGLNLAHNSVDTAVGGGSNTDLGINLLGGLRFTVGTLSAFAEAKIELSGGDQFVLTLGALFGSGN